MQPESRITQGAVLLIYMLHIMCSISHAFYASLANIRQTHYTFLENRL